MEIVALKTFSDGKLSMYKGEVREIDDDKATVLIAEGYAKKYVDPIELPSVTSDDNGKVLSVVDGAWAKATASGGSSVFLVTATFDSDSGYTVTDKTYSEILEAFENGNYVLMKQNDSTGGGDWNYGPVAYIGRLNTSATDYYMKGCNDLDFYCNSEDSTMST